MNTEIRIHDEKPGAENLLIDFADFLSGLESKLKERVRGEWEILRGAYGYGEHVCNIEASLEEQDSIHVGSEEIIPLLMSGEEYFENVVIRVQSTGIEFGIHDSTFFFVRAELNEIEDVDRVFSSTTIHQLGT